MHNVFYHMYSLQKNSTSAKYRLPAATREIPCCRWEPEDWFPLYAGLASLALLWLVMTAGMVRVYTISGTIAQWYFAPGERAQCRP